MTDNEETLSGFDFEKFMDSFTGGLDIFSKAGLFPVTAEDRLALSISESAFAVLTPDQRLMIAHQFFTRDFSDVSNFPAQVKMLIQLENDDWVIKPAYEDAIPVALDKLLKADRLNASVAERMAEIKERRGGTGGGTNPPHGKR